MIAAIAKVNAKLKGYRTLIVNALVGVPSALLLLGSMFQNSGIDFTPVLSRYFTAQDILALTTTVSIIGVFLRFLTTTPVGQKGP